MRKRAWVAWMLIIAMMITLWPASVGYALERPVVYPEMNDGYQSEYPGETERVRVYDNGEKKKVDVMIVPVDEVQALVWHPVSGASYYLYSIRDVDNDEPVIVNEQTTNYWITLADMLDWDGPLAYDVTYKIAAAACTSPDDCYWSTEPFYFQLVETVQPEETETPEPEICFSGSFDQKRIELTVGDVTTVSGRVCVEGDTLNRVTYQIDGWDGDDGNNRYCSQELRGQVGVELSQMNQLVLDTTRAPLNEPGEYTLRLVASVESGEWEKLASMTVVVKATGEPTHSVTAEPTTPEPQTVLSGAFASDYIELNIGDVTTVGGSVSCTGSTLNRVTYQIEGWDGNDGNNRYCTQEVQNVASVDLSQMNQLVLDTNREPLNVPGEYKLWVVASAADGIWNHLASMTVVVKAADEPTHSETDAPTTPEPQTVLSGAFASDYIELNIGDVTTVGGSVSCTGSTLNRVTYQIEGWDGNDGNNRYCTQEVQDVASVDLSQMNQLVLDTNRAPLNVSGEYKLWVVASAADGVWNHLASMTVVVKDTGEPTHSATDEPATPAPVTPAPTTQAPAPQVELNADIMNSSIAVKLGDTARIEGWVTCKGGQLDRVTYLITDHPVEGDENNRQYSKVLGNVSELDLADADELILDTNRTPLNVPGDYQIEVYAKAVGMEKGVRLANVQVHVYTEEETETHPTPGNNPPSTVDESRKPGHGEDNTQPPATNDVTTPAPTADLSGVKLQGQFDDDSVELNLGESMRVGGTVVCTNDTIVRVTYHFKDHEVPGDPNNRYCTAVLSGQDYVALESLGDLLLDTARDPLNKGGSYTLELWAATAKGKAECVDTMTVVVNAICPVYGGAHKMDYTGYEAAHPHKVFRRCACGKAEYTGTYQKMNPCCECGNHYKDSISESAGQYSAHCNKCGMNIALASTSLLSKGDRGEAVRALQNQLLTLGYTVNGGADAIFGSGTEKALTQYQGDMVNKNPALKVSKGVLDVETWRALYGKDGNVTETVSACQHNGKRENVREVKTVEYTNITAVNHDVVVSTYEEYTCLECGEKVSKKVSTEAPVTVAHKADVDSPQCVCGCYIGKSAAWYTEGLDGALYNTRAEAVKDIVNRASGQIIDTSKYDNLLNRTNYYYQCNIIMTDDLVKCVTMLTNAYVNHEFFAADGDIAKYGVGADGSITAQKMFSQTVGDVIVKYAGTAVFDSYSKALDPCFEKYCDTMDQLTKNLASDSKTLATEWSDVLPSELADALDFSKTIKRIAGEKFFNSYEDFKKFVEGTNELYKIIEEHGIKCTEQYYNMIIKLGEMGPGNEEISKESWEALLSIYKDFTKEDLKNQRASTGLDGKIKKIIKENFTIGGNSVSSVLMENVMQEISSILTDVTEGKEFYDFFAQRMNLDYDKTIAYCDMLRNCTDSTWELSMAEYTLRREVTGGLAERKTWIIAEYIVRQAVGEFEKYVDKGIDKAIDKIGMAWGTVVKLTAEGCKILGGTKDILSAYRKMEGQYNNYKTLYANYERLWAEYEKYPDDANRKEMMESALKSSLYCIIDAAESYYNMVDTIDKTIALQLAQAIFGPNADIEELKTMIKYEIDSKKDLLSKIDPGTKKIENSDNEYQFGGTGAFGGGGSMGSR